MVVGTQQGWLSHCYGAIRLFLAAGPTVCYDDFGKSLFWATYAQALQPAMMTSKPSVFDEPDWLAVRLPSDGKVDSLGTPQCLLVFARVPRLMARVRLLRHNPDNKAMTSRAMSLMTELLNEVWTEEERQDLLVGITSDPEDAASIPISFKYREEQYGLALRRAYHWTCKILLSGLCQSLHDLGATSPAWPSIGACRNVEFQCALRICMTVESAKLVLPYGASHMVFPMQAAWGVFWRLSKTYPHVYPAASCAGPAAMMEFVRSRAEFFMSVIKPVELKTPGLVFLTERLQGDPMRPIGTFCDRDSLTTNVALHKLAISVQQEVQDEDTASHSDDSL